MSPALSLVIPARNEQARLPFTLAEVESYLCREQIDSEVIVVDSGSHDATSVVVQQAAIKFRGLRLLRSDRRGKGLAVRTGVMAARGDIVIFADADLSWSVDDLSRFMALVNDKTPIVIGSREGHGARRIGEPFYRHLMGRVFNRVVQTLAVPGIEDSQCGFKAFTRESALDVFGRQRIDGWDNAKGGTTFEQFLSANGGKVDGVLAANDGLAGAIITVLQKNGLAGKVPVTGQDASAAGLKAILQGSQYSTVFKPIQEEADATAQIAAALVKGDTAAADAVAKDPSTDPTGNRTVKSKLLTPQAITKQNVKTVVDAGYIKASEICDGDTAAVCAQLGISS